MIRVLHLLQGLSVGGMEKGTVQVASRARQEGQDHRILLFDRPFRGIDRDIDPNGVPLTFLPRSPGVDWRFSLRLRRLLCECPVDLVHARNDTALFYAAAAIRFMQRRPALIATFHNFPFHATGRARIVTHWASKRTRAVVAVSDELRQRLTRTRWVHECATIWNGVDINAFQQQGTRYGVREELGLSANTLLIANIARFATSKRQTDLLQAFQRLRHPRAALVFLGEGPTLAEVRLGAASIENVFFIRKVSGVAEFLRDIDILVLCSEDEGAPRAVLEGMAAGRAIVATGVGGVPEILELREGNAGILVPPANVGMLAQAIDSLAYNEPRRVELGELARRRAVTAFSSDQEWASYKRLYDRVLMAPISSE